MKIKIISHYLICLFHSITLLVLLFLNLQILLQLFLGVSGKLAWADNYVSFIDTMLQFSILGINSRELYLPTRLQRVTIDRSNR